ncbi:GMC family oxidoreductase [Novosphingobium colocasiae]|uniref:GMC family oxidoreductase n=1 Tax=Novosphingobium colocasiae TaxID=1256513 RepID=UPI0035AEE741
MDVWDYIIVGAGSAGCVLADRLSADPTKRVLLLEAGGSDRNPLQRVPLAGVFLNYGHAKRDWRYQTDPDPTRNNRSDAWPRGRLLGGTSSMNGMIYVRGAPEDFDHWASLGNDGWRYADVLPVYKSMEDHEYAWENGAHAGEYGRGGPLKVKRIKGVHPLANTFVSACAELGIPTNDHYNAGDQEGAFIITATHSGRMRYSSAQAFLQPARRRPNLQVMTGVHVERVLLEGRRAVGVLARRPGEAEARPYRAGTVVLSGGAVNSPQLLLLSGIGPAAHLRDMGVEVRHDLPGVGRNLQDHPNCAVQAKVNVPTLDWQLWPRITDGMNWLFYGRGTYASAAAQGVAFARSSDSLSRPDIQVHIMPLAFNVTPNGKTEFASATITLQSNVSRPRSRGYIELRSPDPMAAPVMQPNMLADPDDIQRLTRAGQLCRQILDTEAFRPHVVKEVFPGRPLESDLDWEAHLRETAASGAHQCGTCKMGVDEMAVVDPQLKVRGIDGLRVADASIMPTITSGNTNGPCMMIGGKAAQMILRDSN